MNYFAIDLGAYQVSVAHDQISLVEPIILSHQFLAWICYYQDQWLVGNTIKENLNHKSYTAIYYDFFRYIGKTLAVLPEQEPVINSHELMEILFKHIIEHQKDIQRAKSVIAVVPAYFTQQQKQSIQDIAKLVDIPIVDTVTAAYAKALYIVKKPNFHLNVGDIFAVYEWGASQFEFALFKVVKNQEHLRDIEQIGHAYLEIGGYQCDLKLWHLLAEKYQQKRQIPLKLNTFHYLDPQLEATKICLNHYKERGIKVWGDFNFSFNQKEFLQQIQPDLDKTLECIKNTLLHTHIEKSKIKTVYLTGGSSQMWMIKPMLSNYFADIPIYSDFSSDLAVKGAVIYAQHSSIPITPTPVDQPLPQPKPLQDISDIFTTHSEESKDIIPPPKDVKIKTKYPIGWGISFLIFILCVGVAYYILINYQSNQQPIIFAEECQHLAATTIILIDQNMAQDHKNKLSHQAWKTMSENSQSGDLISIYTMENQKNIQPMMKLCKPKQNIDQFKTYFEQGIQQALSVPKTQENKIAESITAISMRDDIRQAKYHSWLIFSDFMQQSNGISIASCTQSEHFIGQFKQAAKYDNIPQRPTLKDSRILLYTPLNTTMREPQKQCWTQFWLWFFSRIDDNSSIQQQDF